MNNIAPVLEFSRFLLKSLVLGVLLYIFSLNALTNNLGVFLLLLLLVSLPVALSGIYLGTMKRLLRLQAFEHKGWIFRIFSSRLLSTIGWTLWGLFASFFLLLQLASMEWFEWWIFPPAAILFWLCFDLSRTVLKSELKPLFLQSSALSFSRIVSPLLLLLVYLLIAWLFLEVPSFDSLQEAINYQQQRYQYTGNSALLGQTIDLVTFLDGTRDFALTNFSPESMRALLVHSLGAYVFFYTLCTLVSVLLIPAREFRRIIQPLHAGVETPVPLVRVAALSGVISFITLFVLLPLAAYLEAWLQQQPEAQRPVTELVQTSVTRLEQIGDAFYQEGTIAKLEQNLDSTLQQLDQAELGLEAELDQAFAIIESNVDLYLDWYYSLGGEYTRIANLMIGELEEYMTRKLADMLNQGNSLEKFQARLNVALSDQSSVMTAYQEQTREILEQNRVSDNMPENWVITERLVFSDMAEPVLASNNLQHRLAGSAMSGAIATFVIPKIIGKVISKNTFKLAVKTVAKVTTGKLAGSGLGAGAGAAGGAAVGSVVPGVGTAIGAIVGGIIGGIAVGVTIDAVLLEIEETVNRDEFKAEILDALHTTREEIRLTLTQ